MTQMRPGRRYIVMWVIFYLAVLGAGIMTPWNYDAILCVGIAIVWAICAYISFRQGPEPRYNNTAE